MAANLELLHAPGGGLAVVPKADLGERHRLIEEDEDSVGAAAPVLLGVVRVEGRFLYGGQALALPSLESAGGGCT